MIREFPQISLNWAVINKNTLFEILHLSEPLLTFRMLNILILERALKIDIPSLTTLAQDKTKKFESFQLLYLFSLLGKY